MRLVDEGTPQTTSPPYDLEVPQIKTKVRMAATERRKCLVSRTFNIVAS
jgi:hypothetical protein